MLVARIEHYCNAGTFPNLGCLSEWKFINEAIGTYSDELSIKAPTATHLHRYQMYSALLRLGVFCCFWLGCTVYMNTVMRSI